MQQKHLENIRDYMNNLKKTKKSQFNSEDMMKIYDVQMEYFYSNGEYNSALDYTIKLFEQFKSEKLDEKDTVVSINHSSSN